VTDARRRVVITGLGLVSAYGEGASHAWTQLCAGRSGVTAITRFDARGLPTGIAAQVPDDAWAGVARRTVEWRERGRIARMAVAAADAAVEDAGRPFEGARQRAGVVVATGTGVFEHDEVFGACAGTRASRQVETDWATLAANLRRSAQPDLMRRRSPGSVPADLAERFGVEGPVMSVMTACAGGTHAVGDALRWIRSGRADVVLAGGADSEVTPMGVASFSLLGALSRHPSPAHASRPFDLSRDGFVLGEGAAMLVLEERERALARGARIYAEVAGFGQACDAFRATDPHPDGRGAVAAMTLAMADAGLAPTDIAYINAHGTSTVANDRAETVAIRKVFGAHADRLAVSSTKSMLGHALVAAGAIEAVVTALSVAHQFVHPTINLDTADPACDLDYVAHTGRPQRISAALSNSFAFGGQTACLVVTPARD
jgi:3-oxoacyl-[acyl-carrier-protein] synthase II